MKVPTRTYADLFELMTNTAHHSDTVNLFLVIRTLLMVDNIEGGTPEMEWLFDVSSELYQRDAVIAE